MHMCRAQYREEYGSSEVLSRLFTCELCSRKVKHTRPVVGKQVELFTLLLLSITIRDAPDHR